MRHGAQVGTDSNHSPLPPMMKTSFTLLILGCILYRLHAALLPLTQGEEESFVERWLGLFAAAAQGHLHSPTRLPEEEAQGSWRQSR